MFAIYFEDHFISVIKSLLIYVLLFVNNNCLSQQSNIDFKYSERVNLNSLDYIEAEQSLREAKCEKIMRFLKLSLKEKELLLEIKQLSTEARQCLKDADLVCNEINEISKTLNNSDVNKNNNLKIERKIRRQVNNELSYRYDAEELFEISNNLLYNIYENHFPDSETLLTNDKINKQQIIDLNEDAQKLFNKAIKNQDKANYNFNYKAGLDYLKKANFFKREAIKKFEYAYSLYYNIPFNKDDLSVLIADLNTNILDKQALKSDSLFNSEKQKIASCDSENENIYNVQLDSNKRIVYRVQIGAFTKKVDIKEFHGLYPLLEDKKDQKEFTKFMVGEYFSYKAAGEAKRIIVKTTNYQDAFVVAYKNDIRVAVNDELIK